MSGACIRGCKDRGKHFAACPDFAGHGPCRGCVPTETRDGSLICDRCFGRLKRVLSDAPDVVVRIRTEADPLKALTYDREAVSGGKSAHAPAPVGADLLDAGDAVMTTLHRAAAWVTGGDPWVIGSDGIARSHWAIPPGAEASDLYHLAKAWADEVIAALPDIAGLAEVVDLAAVVIDMPTDKDQWSIAKALSRWPIEERSFWAAEPCPDFMGGCGLRSIKVTPPRRAGMAIRFECTKCGWEPESGDRELWIEVFGKAAA